METIRIIIIITIDNLFFVGIVQHFNPDLGGLFRGAFWGAGG